MTTHRVILNGETLMSATRELAERYADQIGGTVEPEHAPSTLFDDVQAADAIIAPHVAGEIAIVTALLRASRTDADA